MDSVIKEGILHQAIAVYPYDIPFFNKYNNSGKIDLQVELKDDDNPNTASTTYSFTQTDLEVETMFGACVAPQVAAVIKVTDEVKEDFNWYNARLWLLYSTCKYATC